MDITSYVVQGRDKALLYGDYATYHSQLSQRLLNTRKKLGIATRNRGKFHKKDEVTAEQIAQSPEHAYLALLTSERAYAQAMSFKAAHTANQKGIVGRTRSHIISRLRKAGQTADQLVVALSKADVSGASTTDVLEAKAYAAMIHGATLFEKQNWELCLQSYATCRIIYTALSSSAKGDIFKDLLSETIDPSIRYAAYRLKTPRTIPIPIIARKAFLQSDSALVGQINNIDPSILKQGERETTKGAEGAPKTITWRKREVTIEDAQIALAWGAVGESKEKLAEKLEKSGDANPFDVAAAYDGVLTTTQDAVDATKQAIDELRAEGVGQGDARMQSLQITRTAVNYEMLSWRIGRNRVLTGEHDGAVEKYGSLRRRQKTKAGEEPVKAEKELPPGKKIAKLKEKVALYDGNLQNLESIKELPGVANDEGLAAKLEASVKYFEALSNLSIARSHAIVGNVANALALIDHSLDLSNEAAEQLPEATDKPTGPLNVDIGHADITFLTNLLTGELQRHRAIVHIDNLRKAAAKDNDASTGLASAPLVERLHEYPVGGVDLGNIVEFPPKLSLIPVKPIFLDVAWNYIDYPGHTPAQPAAKAAAAAAPASKETEQKQEPAKRGWFGFGRS